jgi:hypothetical protein
MEEKVQVYKEEHLHCHLGLPFCTQSQSQTLEGQVPIGRAYLLFSALIAIGEEHDQ